MSEENLSTPPEAEKDPTPAGEESKQKKAAKDLGDNLKNFGGSLWDFVKNLMNITHDTDYNGSIERVRNDIDFQGYNVWVLVCSIIIASIGLNQNSTAVIIGAMLISPLMGPIVGAGMALGTNNLEMLIRSLKSFGIAVGVALITSYIYFILTPISQDTPELLSRTSPTPLDAIIALFGGLAGVIAVTRKEKTNVIPGVAIATALMPPLCTAGYGLSIGNMSYFLGAMYLLLLNTVFIWLTTFITVRYLNFPMKEFPDQARERKVKRWLWIISILIVVPSTWKFVNVIRKARFEQSASIFVKEVCTTTDPTVYISLGKLTFDPDSSIIEVVADGGYLNDDVIDYWNSQLPVHGFSKTYIKPKQLGINMSLLEGQRETGISVESFEQLYKNKDKLQARALQLQAKIDAYRAQEYNVPKIEKYVKMHYPEISKFSHGYSFSENLAGQIDTVFTIFARWNPTVPDTVCQNEINQLSNYLKLEMGTDTVDVIRSY